jgi:ADP-ribose pyrophosphatase
MEGVVSMIKKLLEKTHYEGRRFTVKWGVFQREDGSTVEREWVTPGDVVAVLPFDDEFFYVGEQPREVTGRRVVSLCAGKIDEGEQPMAAAKRELAEEFGLAAQRWLRVAAFYTSEGITDEFTHLYLATGLSKAEGVEYDVDEDVRSFGVELRDIEDMIDIADNAKLLIGLGALQRHLALESRLCAPC